MRLRSGVGVCCVIVVVSLVTQLMIWGVCTFMDVRFEVLEQQITPAAVVSAEPEPVASLDARPFESPDEAKATSNQPAPNPNRVATKYDLIMDRASALALTCGTIAMLMMIPLLMVGVMLSAGSATPGVDNVVSAFMWSLFVTMIVLPAGQFLGLPWPYGGLVPYAHMTENVDLEMTDGRWGGLIFHGRFCLLPLACIVGVTVVGLRFSSGVRAGVIPREDMRLDPTLEREAAGIKATSLLGGRNAAALRNIAPQPAPSAPIIPQTPMASAAQPAPSLTAVTANGAGEIKPGMLTATPGEAPRRLI
jgi:hypothetical protein